MSSLHVNLSFDRRCYTDRLHRPLHFAGQGRVTVQRSTRIAMGPISLGYCCRHDSDGRLLLQ
jgi:hypothetical protein